MFPVNNQNNKGSVMEQLVTGNARNEGNQSQQTIVLHEVMPR